LNTFINKIFNCTNDATFEKLALEIFDFQMENNLTYASYAALILRGKNPENINEIPFLPVEFFKTEQIICQGQAIEEIFLSSGTTGEQSKHLVSNIELYKSSYQKAFQLFYGDITDYCILALLPSYKEREGSSLIYMVDDLIKKIIEKNEKQVKEYKSGKTKIVGFFVGQVLKDAKGSDPSVIKDKIISYLDSI